MFRGTIISFLLFALIIDICEFSQAWIIERIEKGLEDFLGLYPVC